MVKLGSLYEQARGVPKDYAQALHWYRKGAEKSDAQAMSNLGSLYDNGLGVSRDYAQARVRYQKAADKGDDGSKEKLKKMKHK